MRPIKKYEHGGVHFDLPEEEPTRRELRRQDREDKEGMIPARFRNRGQEGLDDYRAMMARRRKRGGGLGIMDALKGLFQQQRGSTQKADPTVGMKCSKNGCGAYQ